MDFKLTEEHQMVARMVREFAEKEVGPVIKEYDRAQEVNWDAIGRMAELGILGICIPVRYGGQGMDYVSLGLVCEELERVDSTLRVVMSVQRSGMRRPPWWPPGWRSTRPWVARAARSLVAVERPIAAASASSAAVLSGCSARASSRA